MLSSVGELQSKNFSMLCYDPNIYCKYSTESFLETIEKYASLQNKFIRGKQAPFTNRDVY